MDRSAGEIRNCYQWVVYGYQVIFIILSIFELAGPAQLVGIAKVAGIVFAAVFLLLFACEYFEVGY